MAKNYPIPQNPEYNPNIPQIKNGDYVDAEAVLNPVLQQIIENQAAHQLHKADLVDEKVPVEQLPAEIVNLRSAMPGVLIEDIEIPAAGWAEDSTLTDYPYAAVVSMEKATAQMSPIVSLKPGSLETARAACLCPSVEAQDGAIKLWAKIIPTADLIATVTLLSEGAVQGSGGESPGGSYVLPVATRTRLGGVKIGSDVDVAADGTISVNAGSMAATDEEVREMLKNTLK